VLRKYIEAQESAHNKYRRPWIRVVQQVPPLSSLRSAPVGMTKVV
jgi:hypothetical protein